MKLKIKRIVKNWKYAPLIKYTENFIQNPISSGRRYAPQKLNVDLWKKAYAEFNLAPKKEDPYLGCIVMNHYEKGAFTQRHKDKTELGFIHVRLNLMLKKPPKGGNIFIDDENIDIEKNDLWLILTNLEEHGSTPIEGGDRLTYSFGSLIPVEEAKHIY
tara:strand:- start:1490 stop:1966 length:477 start_codon:yes stop_codon:yes gene_type:complete